MRNLDLYILNGILLLRYHLEDFSNYAIRTHVFKDTYDQNKNHFFINHLINLEFMHIEVKFVPRRHSRRVEKTRIFPREKF